MPFTPGLKLAGAFFADVVRPLLAESFPDLRYAAALLGWGSEVLGYDSARSTDHNWGPRLQILTGDADAARYATEIDAMLDRRLPSAFRGFPTRFARSEDPGGTVRHWVEVSGLSAWITARLGFDPCREITVADWLSAPTQRLAEVTAGAVFHDAVGDLGRARARLSWYPADVWRYVLACQWQRVAEEEAFAGRCAEVGDDLGSAVVAARLARDLMRLCLLMHRRYPPYSKWVGTAFARLPCAAWLGPALAGAIRAPDWPTRERHLCRALEATAALHNEFGLTKPLDTRTRPFHQRPYQVLDAARFAAALRDAITDPKIARLPLVGAVDQYIDSTEALGSLWLLRTASEAVAGSGHR